MDNLKYSLFDLFSFVFPGAMLLMLLGLQASNYSLCTLTFSRTAFIFSKLNLYAFIVFVLISYCIGFLMSLISEYLLKLITCIAPLKQFKYSQLKKSEKYILAREFSRENFKYIELWNVLKKLAGNLGLTIFLCTVCFKIKYECFSWWYFTGGLMVCLLSFLKSLTYHQWAMYELDNIVGLFKLSANAEELIKTKNKL